MTDQSKSWKRYRVVHDTEYCYAYSVSNARHRAHLTPSNRKHQTVHSATLSINQPLAESSEGIDYFGNAYRDFAITSPHRLLTVRAHMDISVQSPTWPTTSPLWHGKSLARRSFDPADSQGTEFALACAAYLVDSPMIPSLPEAKLWALKHLGEGKPLHQQLLLMTQAMREEFVFDASATTVGTPLTDVFRNKRGVCQDFAHLLIAALRSTGIPARYVSGYILTHPAPGKPRLIGADATHAWVEAWCPGHGWLGLDPTNGKAVSDEFVTVATGRDYADVIPLRGVVVGGGEHSLEVSVTMTPETEILSNVKSMDQRHG
ncbi:MAG: transglutaminase domain-containing protein [Fluviibacter sp.]